MCVAINRQYRRDNVGVLSPPWGNRFVKMDTQGILKYWGLPYKPQSRVTSPVRSVSSQNGRRPQLPSYCAASFKILAYAAQEVVRMSEINCRTVAYDTLTFVRTKPDTERRRAANIDWLFRKHWPPMEGFVAIVGLEKLDKVRGKQKQQQPNRRFAIHNDSFSSIRVTTPHRAAYRGPRVVFVEECCTVTKIKELCGSK